LLTERAPSCRAVMLTTFDDEHYVTEALRAGAVGYLLKDLPAAELAQAVRLAHAGVAQFDAGVARQLAARTPPGTVQETLTGREVDVLRLVAGGSTNREIARRLH